VAITASNRLADQHSHTINYRIDKEWGTTMRIDRLAIQNFCGFSSLELKFDPQFNLLVGGNGSGKTSILDAVYIAAGSWLLGIDGPRKAPTIDDSEVRLADIPYGEGQFSFEKQYPVSIQARGNVMGESIEWTRIKTSDSSTTRYGASTAMLEIGRRTVSSMRAGENVDLPLISSYGTERLWIEPETPRKESRRSKLRHKERPTRLNGYRNIQFLIHEEALFDWIAAETLASLQNGSESGAFKVVKNAMVGCIEDAKDLYYDVRREEVVVVFAEHGTHPYEHLSDGQRVMLTVVGDLAKKANRLNPHMGAGVLDQTRGIVTIDELDIHLHPKWQRHVIRDLKRTFPKIQFIASTHSPQLVGEAAPHEVILLPDVIRPAAQAPASPPQSFGMDSNWILKHVMEADDRDKEIKHRLEETDRLILKLEFEAAEEALRRLRDDIGNHPDIVRLSARIDRLAGKAQ
jgi:predicted ATP-binding protein involved in virulence